MKRELDHCLHFMYVCVCRFFGISYGTTDPKVIQLFIFNSTESWARNNNASLELWNIFKVKY